MSTPPAATAVMVAAAATEQYATLAMQHQWSMIKKILLKIIPRQAAEAQVAAEAQAQASAVEAVPEALAVPEVLKATAMVKETAAAVDKAQAMQAH